MTTPSRARETTTWIASLHDEITGFLESLDGGGRFVEDRWERPGGGGGVTRVLTGGALIEKAGVNRSAVHGPLSPALAERLAGRPADPRATDFFVTGVSVVAHPRSPMVPTVHLNVRYFELADAGGAVVDAWIGGGTDLTPTYPFPDDARHFHSTLRGVCDRHDAAYYPRFKRWCDDYFVNGHRGGERRGVGGVFFDYLRPDGEAKSLDALLAFADAIGRALPAAYGPIAERRRGLPYGERERRLQLLRRGRYVEFNLVHDRGTLFGLQTSARIESVLMSLPPLAAWEYAPVEEPGTIEAELAAMLLPREWAED
jgi:coproporphyrinogen III oxidase